MARRKGSARRRRRGSGGFLYKLLSILLICGCLVAAVTLFFRVDTVIVTGTERYTEAQVLEASGVESGDNLFLLNKYQVIRDIVAALPYVEIENTRVQRKLPDTLLIRVQECGKPLAWAQDGTVWLVSTAGKIVDQTARAAGYPVITGCRLLAPAVGEQIVLDTEFESRRESLLRLLKALEEGGKLEDVGAIHLEEAAYISIDYMERFTVEMKYDADFAYKLRTLDAILETGKIQENMSGTFNMRGEDGKTNFIQNSRK